MGSLENGYRGKDLEMARSYSFRFNGSATDLTSRIKREAEANHVKCAGDEKSGVVEGMGAKASYEISGDVIDVTVHRIPFIVSWGTVESELTKFAPGGGAERIK